VINYLEYDRKKAKEACHFSLAKRVCNIG